MKRAAIAGLAQVFALPISARIAVLLVGRISRLNRV